MQENFSSALSDPGDKRIARWLALAGVVSPILFVADFTIAGFLRPGYSPIRQSISTLGVGTNVWLVDGGTAIFAVLLFAFAIGFFLGMRQIMRKGGRVACLVPLASCEHWDLQCGHLYCHSRHSSAALDDWIPASVSGTSCGVSGCELAMAASARLAWIWLVLISHGLGSSDAHRALLCAAGPRSASGGSSSSIGGLIERALVLVTFAWPVVIGWRLFVQEKFHQQRSSPIEQQREPQQSRMEMSDKR